MVVGGGGEDPRTRHGQLCPLPAPHPLQGGGGAESDQVHLDAEVLHEKLAGHSTN